MAKSTVRQKALPLEGLPPSVLLADQHYLGPSHRSVCAFEDAFGVMVFAAPTARHLPTVGWFELVRWCLTGGENGGTQQWKAARWKLLTQYPDLTTVVSYSDPSVGHTGALYRACGWLWAPTWQRLKPPPSGNGKWGDKAESVKDRWVAVLRPDSARAAILSVKDEKARRDWPFAEYREPRWKRGRPQLETGGGDYARWIRECTESAKSVDAVGQRSE